MAATRQVAVDIGGTFTDILLVDHEAATFAIEKVLTTHTDPVHAVREGLSAALERSNVSVHDLDTVVHATTLVTNAVIERKGARTALLITEGFRDTLHIGREHRYDMYDVRLEKPEPLVARFDIFPVPERVLVDGHVQRPLDEPAVAAIAEALERRGIESVAVCLLHSYRHPEHETHVRQLLIEKLPGLRVTLSHEVVGQLREYERASTSVANAYVLGLVDEYLSRLEAYLSRSDHQGRLLVMLSSGAVATPETARAFPVRLIESGPAAGALAAAESGLRMGQQNLLSFDMGGTTAKACIITDGRPAITNGLEVARLSRFRPGSGIPLQISSVELIEVGAGGGSLARIDPLGLVQVGPDSAGSDPGPVSYGRGGKVPAVTDADLLLGYLDPGFFLGGRMQLDAEAAYRAVQTHIADPLLLDPIQAAWAIHEVVNENMANAARIHAVEKGADLERLPLFAFGGAGPVHAYRVAQNLGIKLIISPLGAGVGSTIGLLAAPLAFDFVRTAVAPLTDLDWQRAEMLIRGMERDGHSLLTNAGIASSAVQTEVAVDMRLAGQAHEITVELRGPHPRNGDEPRLHAAFEATYESLYGRRPPDVPMEVVSWRVRVFGPRPRFPIMSSSSDKRRLRTPARAIKGSRKVYSPEAMSFHETTVYDRYRLRHGMQFDGPAIIEERESTFVVGAGGRVSVDAYGNLIVEVK